MTQRTNRHPQNGRISILNVDGKTREVVSARIGKKTIVTALPPLDFPRNGLGVWCGDWMLVGYAFDGEKAWTWLDSKNAYRPRKARTR